MPAKLLEYYVLCDTKSQSARANHLISNAVLIVEYFPSKSKRGWEWLQQEMVAGSLISKHIHTTSRPSSHQENRKDIQHLLKHIKLSWIWDFY